MEVSSNLNVSLTDLSQFQNNSSSDLLDVYSQESNQATDLAKMEASQIHNAAVNVSISLESIKAYLNIKSVEMSQDTNSAQQTLVNISNNEEIYNFLSGNETSAGLSLSSIGYEGKAITELNPYEAQELISDEGFFGVEETSQRVSSFVFTISGDDVDNLQESRRGVVEGFEAAEKLWGGQLPDISYETQAKTLELIDAKIAELMQKDMDRALES